MIETIIIERVIPSKSNSLSPIKKIEKNKVRD